MSGVDTRNISRDSLFLMADVHLDGHETPHRVKVRNLSSGGMMAEGGPQVRQGMPVAVVLRNVGRVDGIIAWVEPGSQQNRFGIAFSREIDPKIVRAPATASEGNMPPRFVRTVGIKPHGEEVDPRRLRKI